MATAFDANPCDNIELTWIWYRTSSNSTVWQSMSMPFSPLHRTEIAWNEIKWDYCKQPFHQKQDVVLFSLSKSKVAASDIPENTVLQDLEQEPRWGLEQYHLRRLSSPSSCQPALRLSPPQPNKILSVPEVSSSKIRISCGLALRLKFHSMII